MSEAPDEVKEWVVEQIFAACGRGARKPFNRVIHELSKEVLERVVEMAGSKTRAAEICGMTRISLNKRLGAPTPCHVGKPENYSTD